MYITMITIASSYVQCYDNSFIASETIFNSQHISYRVCQTLCKKSHIFNVHIPHYPRPCIQHIQTYKCMSLTTLHPLYNVSLVFICNRYCTCISYNDFSLFHCLFNDNDSLCLLCLYCMYMYMYVCMCVGVFIKIHFTSSGLFCFVSTCTINTV